MLVIFSGLPATGKTTICRAVARRACSDEIEPRRRSESRVPDIGGLPSPSRSQIRARDYEPCTVDRVVIGTGSRTLEESATDIVNLIAERWPARETSRRT